MIFQGNYLLVEIMSGQQENNWPTWKLALAISVPVAVGGVLYYQYVHKKKGSPPQQPYPTSGIVSTESTAQKSEKTPIDLLSEVRK